MLFLSNTKKVAVFERERFLSNTLLSKVKCFDKKHIGKHFTLTQGLMGDNLSGLCFHEKRVVV